ncbi:MAG TPA: deoxyribodipyrimidine photo-lyase [Thermoanaerobaculia bacterium]|nr:deoxyribodipyrimidine photo-lyase [Thermoanaerobaculia bacterium]
MKRHADAGMDRAVLARRRLDGFLAAAERYGARRDFPADDATSRLSAALHFGTISPRTVLGEARRKWRDSAAPARAGIEKFVDELCWREFSHAILFHFPRVATGAFRREMDALEWDEPGRRLAAWKDGRTGYPFVDAAMRQLREENWMHNRARMTVASFLTKDLHVDWREGERWFARNLVDADLANNNAAWQWVAGTGADAAPWFRVFNPVLQGRKFDPSGDYVRRYVPELAHLSGEEIHEPRDPIVDHAVEKEEALRRYRRVVGK